MSVPNKNTEIIKNMAIRRINAFHRTFLSESQHPYVIESNLTESPHLIEGSGKKGYFPEKINNYDEVWPEKLIK